MSEKIVNFTRSRRFLFSFGCDEGLYAMAFDSKISDEEVRTMIAFLRNCKYKDIHSIIPSYLEKHHLPYSDFDSLQLLMEPRDFIDWAEHLLHSDTCCQLNKLTEGFDGFYTIMDYQWHTPEGGCEGCYYAVKAETLESGDFRYRIIGQTFSADANTPEVHGCFAIRKSDGSGRLQDVARAEGELVLPNLGCVDVIGLLADIENIRTKKQAVKTAVK